MDYDTRRKVLECAAHSALCSWGRGWDNLHTEVQRQILMGLCCQYLSGWAQCDHLPLTTIRGREEHGIDPEKVTGNDLYEIWGMIRRGFCDNGKCSIEVIGRYAEAVKTGDSKRREYSLTGHD